MDPIAYKSPDDDILSDSGLHRLREKAAKIKAMAEKTPTWAVLAAILVGSGGTSAILPKMAPQWYRPDPATGAELRTLSRDLEAVEVELREFLKEGPREVRRNQAVMMGKLDRLIAEIEKRGAEHARQHERQR